MENKNEMSNGPDRLARRLKTADAVVIGLGAMIGSGVFAALGPAAASAGAGLLGGLAAAAIAAYCNAASSAQLAAVYPESGGTYVYGRKQLGAFWGWMAGWVFVAGKTASSAAAALTFGYYVYPSFAKPLALSAVLVFALINCRGIKKTAFVTRLLLLLVLLSLSVIVFAALFGGQADTSRLKLTEWKNGLAGALQSGAILFFAFAGYARIATLGEEIVDPRRTIPRAVMTALGITLAVYALVSVSALLAVGASVLAESSAPLAAAVEAGRLVWLSPVVRVGAAVASLGVLLSLMAGISRTLFSMSANRDLPAWFSAVHPRYKVPHHAEMFAALVIGLIILCGDIRPAIGFSAFTILLYYAITNASAWTLSKSDRLWPRWLSGAGFIFCLTLALSLPGGAVVSGIGVMSVGIVVYKWRR